jgi:hypothetical protein
MRILSVNRLKQLVDVSQHKRDESIELAIDSIESIYIKKYLGDSLFVHVLENSNDSPVNIFVDILLNGDVYSDVNGKKYFFNGLEKTIANLSYCYLMINNTVVTRYGATDKNNNTSVKPQFSSVLEQVSRYRKVAMSYLSDIDFFLRNVDTSLFDTDSVNLINNYRETCEASIDGILNEWI